MERDQKAPHRFSSTLFQTFLSLKNALLEVDSLPEAFGDAAIKVEYMSRISRDIARYS